MHIMLALFLKCEQLNTNYNTSYCSPNMGRFESQSLYDSDEHLNKHTKDTNYYLLAGSYGDPFYYLKQTTRILVEKIKEIFREGCTTYEISLKRFTIDVKESWRIALFDSKLYKQLRICLILPVENWFVWMVALFLIFSSSLVPWEIRPITFHGIYCDLRVMGFIGAETCVIHIRVKTGADHYSIPINRRVSL